MAAGPRGTLVTLTGPRLSTETVMGELAIDQEFDDLKIIGACLWLISA